MLNHTLDDQIEEGLAQLCQRDPIIDRLVKIYGKPQIQPSQESHYTSLVRSIVYQQLSGNAAGAIYKRLQRLYFETPDFDPEEILQTNNSVLRQVGLSERKVTYLKDLAQHFLDGKIKINENLSDTEIGDNLTPVKGIGQWTVDMFLIFKLSRLDVFPFTDLGIKKGLQALLKLKYYPTKEQMVEISNKWRPYRSLATWYLWEVADRGLPKSYD